MTKRSPVKELEVTIRVRNNLLKERRLQLGLSQMKLAKKIGVSYHNYLRLETMKLGPCKKSGEIRMPVIKLLKFYNVGLGELFSPTILAVEQPTAVRKLDASDMQPLLSSHQERLLETNAGVEYDRAELREQIREALTGLSSKEADVLRRRFGFDSGEEQTLAEVGKVYGVSRTRIGQIEKTAYWKIRRCLKHGHALKDYVED